jgi:Rieske Fe-S protein
MTNDLHDVVRQAFDDIIDATGDLGPCPTTLGVIRERQNTPVVLDGQRSQTDSDRPSTSGAHRWVAIAAGLLLVVGVGAIARIAQRADEATTASGLTDLGPADGFASGSITTIDDPPLFVVNDPAAGIIVFDARSTHLNCILVTNTNTTDTTVRVPGPDVAFIDPCHGSLFDRAGNKLAGPAPRSMDRYPVTTDEQRVYVDLSEPIPGDPATTPLYSGDDLDLTLPIVGRGWADAMDFTLSRDTNARFYTAWQTAIADCMQTRGFDDYQPIPYPANGGFEDLVNPLDRRYATVMGYHELPAEPADPNTYTDDSRVQSGECANTAFDSTWGRISAYTSVNDQLRSGLSAAIAGFPDSDVGRTVTSQWAACMAERGHDYASRSDAINAFADLPTISADEIATRLDDLDCDVAVGYTQTQHDWEQSKVDAWRQDHSDTIDTALDWWSRPASIR